MKVHLAQGHAGVAKYCYEARGSQSLQTILSGSVRWPILRLDPSGAMLSNGWSQWISPFRRDGGCRKRIISLTF